MGRAVRQPDTWLLILGSTSVLAWSALALGGSGVTGPALCSRAVSQATSLPASFDLALVLNLPAPLALSWVVMTAAMMPPVIAAPLRHIHNRSFARRRARAMVLFVAGYMLAWMAAGVGLQAVALAARSAAPASWAYFDVAAVTALLWQISPAKQWCLNRCHRRPHLAAFGAAADRDAFEFGLMNGVSCVGACWGLMLPMLLVQHGHMLAMIVVTLFVSAERLENPAPLAWRWRGPGTVLRLATAQARVRLAGRISITKACA
jgi:predicted metal-binding membrane protein